MDSDSPSFVSVSTIRQMMKYGVIGLFSNLCGYAAYLLLTYLGGTPKITMTGLYLLGMCISFFANRKVTFDHKGHVGRSGLRFVLAYALGYFLNFLLLAIFVDVFKFSHQVVQAASIVIAAGFLFIALRFFVFKQEKH